MVLWCSLQVWGQILYQVSGKVLDKENGLPLAGATVLVVGSNRAEITDDKGEFSLELGRGKHELKISFIGFQSITLPVEMPRDQTTELRVELLDEEMFLSGVEVLSTGYQEIPKERATGSFVHLDEELVQRRVSPDLISRLEDVTSGLTVNPRAVEGEQINIRGKSTFFANTQPLIILDNFPYDGPLENINPNDVAAVTVLKDAAAASIWGARAGNGVIVITTKSGAYNSPLKVTFNANTTVHRQPDAFYLPKISPADFLEVESILFGRNFYNSALNSANKSPITPGVEVMDALRQGEISQAEADRQLADLAGVDLRNDINRYVYQPQIDQQYALQISGGGGNQRFGLSLGYDATRENIAANKRNRITFKGSQEFRLWKDRITVSNQVTWTQTNRINRNPGVGGLVFSGLVETYPYAALADRSGNALPVVKDFRRTYILEAEGNGMLNWEYYPLDEIGRMDDKRTSNELRWTTGITAKLAQGLTAELSYQFWTNQRNSTVKNSAESYVVRDLVNRYTQIDEQGNFTYAIPKGGILDQSFGDGTSHQFRSLLRYSVDLGKGNLNALAGYEAKTYQMNSYSSRYYGYDPQLASSIPVDLITNFPQSYNPSLRRNIPASNSLGDVSDRFLSYYFNAGYSHNSIWGLTASIRKDQSNLFGVRSNQRGVPLYSMGMGWTVSEMPFYRATQIPYLKLRGSYGFNGNIDKTLTGETTALYLTSSVFGLNPGVPYARILNPPYPDLQWERIRIVNLGLDMETIDGRVNLTAEYYWKTGFDLISDTQLPPSSGLTSFRGNAANTHGRGFDLTLSTKNLQGAVGWDTQWLFSNNKEEVSNYLLEEPINSVLADGGYGAGSVSPVEGYPLYPVFSYRWAGLDPDTGNPRGYLDGSPTDDFLGVIQNTAIEDLVYHGSATPTVFGALRNTFSWKGLSLSFNITYKLGYYYRRSTVSYTELLAGRPDHSDYVLRWQNPGDELTTQVPSLPASRNINRDNLFRYSEALVEKGDHIRFQDIRMSYRFSQTPFSGAFSSLEVYSYINNVGIIWKASDDRLDPDYQTRQALTSFSIGIRGGF